MSGKLSLREAAKLAGKGTLAITEAIKSGDLSAVGGGVDANGRKIPYEIDPAELNRVFGLKVNPRTGELEPKRSPKNSQPAVFLGVLDDTQAPVVQDHQRDAELLEAKHAAELAKVEAEALRRELEGTKATIAQFNALIEGPQKEAERERERAAKIEAERKADLERLRADHQSELERLWADLERERGRAELAEAERRSLTASKGFWSRIIGR